MRSISSCVALSAIAALALTTGCGLISSDVTDFDLSLPDKTFTVDTSQWMLQDASTFTSTACTQSPDNCAAAATAVCKSVTCFGSCDATTSTCDAEVLVSLYQMVDLLTEKPELKTINDQPLVGVHIDALQYEVDANTLNVATPEMQLYVAPSTITAPGDPQAIVIGTIPPIPAGQTQAQMTIDLGSGGQAALAKFMGDYMNPFNIIVGSSIELKNGDPVPSGKLTAKVSITAHAQLGG